MKDPTTSNKESDDAASLPAVNDEADVGVADDTAIEDLEGPNDGNAANGCNDSELVDALSSNEDAVSMERHAKMILRLVGGQAANEAAAPATGVVEDEEVDPIEGK